MVYVLLDCKFLVEYGFGVYFCRIVDILKFFEVILESNKRSKIKFIYYVFNIIKECLMKISYDSEK